MRGILTSPTHSQAPDRISGRDPASDDAEFFLKSGKTKTDQLLLTAPVSLTKVVLGKYFAMVTVLAVPNVIFCLFPLLIKLQGTAYLLVDYSSIAVFFLLGCVYLAIGMFMSSLTESQIIASISTFGILLVLYLWKESLDFCPVLPSVD